MYFNIVLVNSFRFNAQSTAKGHIRAECTMKQDWEKRWGWGIHKETYASTVIMQMSTLKGSRFCSTHYFVITSRLSPVCRIHFLVIEVSPLMGDLLHFKALLYSL